MNWLMKIFFSLAIHLVKAAIDRKIYKDEQKAKALQAKLEAKKKSKSKT